jgi:hypothetical protein
MNLTNGEKKLFSLLLDRLSVQMANAGCNDIDSGMYKCLTEEEWSALDKAYHEMNGDPQERGLADFCVLYYLRKKVGL